MNLIELDNLINYMRRKRNSFLIWFLEPFTERRGLGHNPDFVLLITVAILLFLGLLFLSSASATLALYKYNDTYYLVKQQLLHGLLPGLVLFYLAIRVNYQKYERWAPLFFIVSLILLLLVSFTNLNNEYGTAQSWIVMGGFSFQPSELVKLLFILFLAGWMTRLGLKIKKISAGVIPFVICLILISFLLLLQPDLGTLSIIILVALAMYYATGAKLTHFLTILGSGGLLFLIMIQTAPYRLNRFKAWLNPDFDPQGIGWQIKQSLIAIGSGGWFGTGLGSSRQKAYLPQPANDSIFPVIAEEIGFIFLLGFLLLFSILMYRGFLIIRQAPDNFAKLLAVGITVWLSVQIFINIAGMIQLLPLTGVPLPLISLGGSNLVVTLISIGILANISKYTTEHG